MEMTKKSKNKGFTLVELIVVLVILAILAAVLIPALLGYIDRAKGQQIVLNAKATYTAAQAELSSMYAKTSGTIDKKPTLGATNIKRIVDTADMPAGSTAVIGVAGTSGHSAYTVKSVLYQEDGKYIYYDGKSWEESTSGQKVENGIGTVSADDKTK